MRSEKWCLQQEKRTFFTDGITLLSHSGRLPQKGFVVLVQIIL